MLHKRKRFQAYLLHLIHRQLYFEQKSKQTGSRADCIAALQVYPLCITNTLHLGLYLHLISQSYQHLSRQTFNDFINNSDDTHYMHDVLQLKKRLLK